jgi:hypothetical protein
MTESVAAKPDSKALSRAARIAKLRTKRMRGADGKLANVYVLDIQDPGFNDQFLKLFQLNAARARRETRALAKQRGIAAE